MLEGSKGFTKDLCAAEGIPTARFVRLAEPDAALEALDEFGLPVVIKADGLAAGKGVTVDLPSGTVTVSAAQPIDRTDIATAVDEAGYTLVA